MIVRLCSLKAPKQPTPPKRNNKQPRTIMKMDTPEKRGATFIIFVTFETPWTRFRILMMLSGLATAMLPNIINRRPQI